MSTTTRTCRGCENDLPADIDPRQRYCTLTCRRRASKVREKVKAGRPLPVDRSCVQCGDPLPKDSGPKRIYCTAICRDAAFRRAEKQRRSVPTGPRTCPVCEETFTDNNPRRLYCSKSCNAKAHRATKKAREAAKEEAEAELTGGDWVLDPVRRIQVWKPKHEEAA